MPNCISINGLEHLPNEQTLLIHYNILCTGTWFLAQLSSAYRNVCDTEWTVMYPNHQHPRHTDFPIAVENPGFPGTFAWNYGGIQGISSENFDAYHSYLVQLTIFNYECFNTGETGGGGTSGTGGGGSTGFTGGGGGTTIKVPIDPPPRDDPPRPGEPPYPGILFPTPGGGPGLGTYIPDRPLPPGGGGPGGEYLPIPGERPGLPGGGGGIGGGVFVNVRLEPLPPGGGGGGGGTYIPVLVEPLPPGGGGGGGGVYLPTLVEPLPPGGETNPGGITPTLVIIEPPPVVIKPIPGGTIIQEPTEPNYSEPEPGIIIEPGIITAGTPPTTTNPINVGIVTIEPGNTTVITNSNPTVTSFYSAERPNQNPPGSTNNLFLSIRPIESISNNSIVNTNSVNLSNIETSNQGVPLNSISSNVVVSSSNSSSSLRKIPFSKIEYNSFIDIQVISQEVMFGMPITVSSFFAPSTPLRAKLVLILQDSSRSFEVSSTPFIDATSATPITCGGSFVSTVFNLGSVTAIVNAINENNEIIATKSSQLVLLQPDNSGKVQSSAINRDKGLPPLIINTPKVPLATNPTRVYLPANTSKYLVYSSISNKSTISAVLKTRYNSEDKYSITILAEVGKTITPGKTLNITELGYSNKKITINEEEIYVDYHNVGIKDISTQGATTFVIELAPAQGNIEGDTEGDLYVSEGFVPRPASASVGTNFITATLPLAAHKYGLIINGKNKGLVPDNYTPIEGITSINGTVTWSSLTLSKGDYFSIIESRNNAVNPFSTPVYERQIT